MRVALTVETFLPKIDGIVSIACLTLEYMRDYGIEALLFAPNQGVYDYAGARVVGVPCVTNPLYPEGKISFPSYTLYREIRDFKPDLVHAIDPALIGMGALLTAKRLNMPTVASYHLSFTESFRTYGLGALVPVVRKSRIWAFNYADHALAPSRSAQRRLQGLGVRRIGWWRRGVNVTNFNPAFRSEEMRKRLSDNHPEDVLLIYVGRLAPDKQVDQIKQVLETVPNTRLALVGGGPAREDLEKHFAGLPVNFVGYLKGAELAAAYASADIFVFTSAHESFGLVLAEAIASGLPVVSSRVGGAEDIIQHGESGYVFDVSDVQQMTEYVRILATDPQKRKAASQQARAFAESLTWDAMMREMFEFYEDILAEKGRLNRPDRPRSPMFQPLSS